MSLVEASGEHHGTPILCSNTDCPFPVSPSTKKTSAQTYHNTTCNINHAAKIGINGMKLMASYGSLQCNTILEDLRKSIHSLIVSCLLAHPFSVNSITISSFQQGFFFTLFFG